MGSHATTVPHTRLVSSFTSFPEKSKDLKAPSAVKRNGLSCQICSSTVTLKKLRNKKRKKRKPLNQLKKFKTNQKSTFLKKTSLMVILGLMNNHPLLNKLRTGPLKPLLSLILDNKTGLPRTIGMLTLNHLNGHKLKPTPNTNRSFERLIL